MKLLKTLLYGACILGALACSNHPEEEPLVEKKARIEIDFEGSLDQYLVNFSIHSLFKGETELISAEIVQPEELEWTQVLTQANTFTISTPGSFSQLIVESEEPVHSFSFAFNVVHSGEIPDEEFEDLSATITVYGNNAEVHTYSYTARPVGEVSEPLSETVRF